MPATNITRTRTRPRPVTFKMNGTAYRTDEETLEVIRSLAPAATATGDASAIATVMHLGLARGRIVAL